MPNRLVNDVPYRAFQRGVLSPNAAKSASLVTNVPSTLFYEGYFHQAILRKAIIEAQAGLQRDLLVLRPGEARLAMLQGRHSRGAGHGLRAVRFHKTATDLLICLLSRIIVYLRIKIDTLLS